MIMCLRNTKNRNRTDTLWATSLQYNTISLQMILDIDMFFKVLPDNENTSNQEIDVNTGYRMVYGV